MIENFLRTHGIKGTVARIVIFAVLALLLGAAIAAGR